MFWICVCTKISVNWPEGRVLTGSKCPSHAREFQLQHPAAVFMLTPKTDPSIILAQKSIFFSSITHQNEKQKHLCTVKMGLQCVTANTTASRFELC